MSACATFAFIVQVQPNTTRAIRLQQVTRVVIVTAVTHQTLQPTMTDSIPISEWAAAGGNVDPSELGDEPATASGGDRPVGRTLESYIDYDNEMLEADGRAVVFKVPTPLRIEGHISGAKVRARKEKARWVDYSGLLAGGRAVAIEAKALDVTSEVSDRLRFSKVSGNQRKRLEDVTTLGGLSVVVTARVAGDTVVDAYVIPVNPGGQMAGMSRPGSFIFSKNERYRIRPGETWLCALERLGVA